MSDGFDVVIVGGGPAGLSAGIWLGRYHRRVRIYDVGEPRNEPAWAVHGYPGLQDPTPIELRRRLIQQCRGEGVELTPGEVIHIEGRKDEFLLRTGAGGEARARRVILAYGLRDYIPDIEGLPALYGTSVFHCADCDGPSVAALRLAVIGWNRHGAALALYLRHWSQQVTLLPHDQSVDLSDDARRTLADNDIDIRPGRIRRVSGHGGTLTQAEFEDGEPLRLDALFFHLGSEPRCNLAQQAGCDTDEDGYVSVDRGQETSVPGLHAAGDITGPPHLAAIAAAGGVTAALAIHRSLLPETRQLRGG